MENSACESEDKRGAFLRRALKRLGCAGAGLLALVLVICIWLFASRAAFMRQAERYEKVTVGMTESQVMETFQKPPGFVCSYGECRILYFYSGHPFSDERKVKEHPERFPWSVTSKDKIPDMYGCFQVLIGPDGKTRAVTWNGETTEMRTRNGYMPGANVSVLPRSIFE